MALELTKKDLAALFGVSTRTVTDWQNTDGFPQPRVDGRQRWYPASAVLQWWFDREVLKVIEGENGPSLNLNDARTKLAVAQTRKAEVETQMKEVELSKTRGDVISISAVADVWLDIVSAARSRMLSIPAKMASVIAPESDPMKIRELLETEIEESLDELSRFEQG